MEGRGRGALLTLVLLLGLAWLGSSGPAVPDARSAETFEHPDAVAKARRTLINLETIDALEQLPGELGPLPEVSVPKDNPMTMAKVHLGKMLFFDPRLSGNNHWSCATCHNPSLGFSDGLPRSLAFGDESELDRHSPTILNCAYNSSQFWDGRAATLEEQALGPILSHREMNADPEVVVDKLNSIPQYREKFVEVFGEPASLVSIAKAIATFERTLVTPGSPFDHYVMGEKEVLSTQEKRGLILFVSKAACTQCHNGSNFTDNQFHNLSVPPAGPAMVDLGRYEVTQAEEDWRAFKTPTLRNVTLTPPYMHNGAFQTLDEVIDFYDRGGGKDPRKSPKLLQLNLTDAEKQDLIAFLKTLTGNLPVVSYPQLPQLSIASAK